MVDIAKRRSFFSPGQYPLNPNALAMLVKYIQFKIIQSRGATGRMGTQSEASELVRKLERWIRSHSRGSAMVEKLVVATPARAFLDPCKQGRNV